MSITVCVPTVRTGTVAHTVRAVLAQTHRDFELLVIGQGPDPRLGSAVAAAADGDPRVRYLHSDRMGLSHARNLAVAASSGDVLAFTDDDCEPDSDWLEVIARCFEDPDVGIVAGSVIAPTDAAGWLATCPEFICRPGRFVPSGDGNLPADLDWIGANFAVRRAAAELIGGFDESLGAGARFPSGEDTDYRFRSWRAGVVTVVTEQAVVHHTYGVRSGVRQGLRHSRNYARGNAAMAAKLTLQGDPFGRAWWSEALLGTSEQWRKDALPHRLPVAVARRWHFARTYRACLRDYRAQPGGLLELRAAGR